MLLRGFDGVPAGRSALKPAEEHILVTPHDALRHPGRASGVDDVQVFAGPRLEVTLLRTLRECGFVLGRLLVSDAIRTVFDHDERLERLETFHRLVDDRPETTLGDYALEIGVFDHVPNFWAHEPVIHINAHGPELEER
jgi:hypothetical protein